MEKTARYLLRRGYNLYQKTMNPRFYALKEEANGMLSPGTYAKLYESVCELPDLDIVEIGGAAGASSIAIAWAIRDSRKESKLIVVEKCEGGSRTEFGGYGENLSIIQNNFRKLGVEDTILLYPNEITTDSC